MKTVERKERGLRTRTFDRNLFILLTVLPGFIFFCITIILPNILSIALSFFKWKGFTWSFQWVGLQNFQKLFRDQIFYKALYNNIFLAVVNVVLTLIVALFIATILSNRSIKHVGFFRSIFYFPNVMSIVVVSMLWKFMYDPQLGIINAALRGIGLENLARIWLGDINTVKPALAVTQLWGGVGLYILIYLTAIRSVNPSLYEAASIDGAGKIRQFFSVTFPIIGPTIKTALIYNMAHTLNGSFAIVKIMTNGAPNNESTVLTTYMYTKTFGLGDYGYGSTIGVFVLAIGFIMYFLIEKLVKSEHYDN